MSGDSGVSREERLLMELCLEHVVYFVWQGPGLLRIDRTGLDVILNDIVGRGIPILGLEGFELNGKEVHPRLDLIFDADRVPAFPPALEAFQTWPEEIWVNVTISSGF